MHQDFTVVALFHPTLLTPDLEVTAAWFQDVFDRPAVWQHELFAGEAQREGYSTDYSNFFSIQDVWIDAINPARYKVAGQSLYPHVSEPQLSHLAWYVSGAEALHARLLEAGISCHDQLRQATTEPPLSVKTGFTVYWTLAEETGLRYQFFSNPAGKPAAYLIGDPRIEPDWVLPPVSSSDPLGLQYCSHHTILTTQPERATSLLVDVLGGRVIHEGGNDLLETHSTYVALADAVFEYAEPSRESRLFDRYLGNAPLDTYEAITWKVVDLDRVQAHLTQRGVGIAARSEQELITDPRDTLGVTWGFTTSVVPGDTRGAKSAITTGSA